MNTSSRCRRPSTDSISKPAETNGDTSADREATPLTRIRSPSGRHRAPSAQQLDRRQPVRPGRQPDHRHRVAPGQLRDRPGQDHLAPVHHHHVTAGQLDLGQQMAGDHDRPAGRGVVGQHWRMARICGGSNPLVGSSSSSNDGRPASACAMPEPLPHALAVAPHPSLDRGRQPGHLQRLLQLGRLDRATGGVPEGASGSASGQVRQESRALDEGARPAAARRRRCAPARLPRTTEPASGRISPTSIRMIVVLPAPLGPSRPTT